MKHQKSNEGNLNQFLIESSDDLNNAFGTSNGNTSSTSTTMMADSFADASGTTKMLMPHEIGASGNANTTTVTLVGQHSLHGAFNDLHHGSSFYHTTAAAGTSVTSNTGTGFNGFHNSTFHNFPHSSLNGISTTATSFSPLVYQQPTTLSNHPITSVSAISSSMPPPLIPYHQPQQSSFYTSNNQGDQHLQQQQQQQQKQHQQKSVESAVSNNEKDEQHLGKDDTATTDEISNTEVVEETEEPEIDIVISNVVCAFSVRCNLALKEIALHGANVEFKRENGMVTMKLRKPYTTASIWSSGKITCTGATSEDQAKVAARRYARLLQKLNFRVRFQNYRVVNVLGTCKMPWAIKIVQFSEKYKKEASYEPELHPGVTYNLKNPTATLKIFSTGSMTVTARSVSNVQTAIEHIYPLVYEFRKPRAEDIISTCEEETYAELIETDPEEDDDDDDDDVVDDDPLEDPLAITDSPPPNKKHKLRDISHLSKRFKGPQTAKRRGSKRPLGKMNDPKQDLIYVSDGELDGDDF